MNWGSGVASRWLTAGVTMAALAFPAAATADTLTVLNDNDSGAGSLREAVADAADGDTVLIPAGTYVLTSGQLQLTAGAHLKGVGAGRTVIRSDGSSRVLLIDPGSPRATVSGMTITGGDAGTDDGGGILSSRSLTLVGVDVVGNRTASGNGSYPSGGGLHVGATGPADVEIRNSLFRGNTSYNGGGVNLSLESGTATLINSTLSGNVAGEPTANQGNGYGGGIEAHIAELVIRNVTIARNRAFGGGEGAGSGIDAFSSGPGSLVVRNTIVAGNRNFVDNGEPPGSAGNSGSNEQCQFYGDLTVTSSNNVEEAQDCDFTDPGSRRSADPRLASLAHNGGPTMTMAPRPGSPAINRGAGCEPTDQRGAPRSLGGACDIGAYELIRCAGVVVNRVGGGGADKLVGTRGRDGILGLGGRDRLVGRAGNDSICGGPGNDRIFGGPGRDKLLGQAGRDVLLGGGGPDLLLGGRGPDLLRGGPGRDRLFGGPGRDRQRQ